MSLLVNRTNTARVARPYRQLAANSFKCRPLPNNEPWMFADTVSGQEDELVTRLRLQSFWSSKAPDERGITGRYSGVYSVSSREDAFSFPVYVVPLDQPTMQLSFKNPYWTSQLQQHFNSVPMPLWEDCKPGTNDYTHQAPANGTDQSMVVIRGYELWEMWSVEPVRDTVVMAPPTAANVTNGITANAQWQLVTPTPAPAPLDFANTRTVQAGDTCLYGGNAFVSLRAAAPSAPTTYAIGDSTYVADYRTWNGVCSPGGSGVHASGTSLVGSMLTAEDVRRAIANQNKPLSEQYIPHMLSVALPATGKAAPLANATPGDLSASYFIAPATRYDSAFNGKSGDPTLERIPEGIRFRLEPTVTDDQIWSWAQAHADANTTALSIFLTNKAARDYGIIVEDTSGTVKYISEDTRTLGTPYNPYDGGSEDWHAGFWGRFGQKFMFSYMKTLAPGTP